MISSYLMMTNIQRDKRPTDSLGVATIRFLAHKYKGLFPILLPSVIVGYIVHTIQNGQIFKLFLQRLPLLFFELIPLRDAGFSDVYPLGISWYLSSMFISLAILYPLCSKFRSNFTLTICPLLAIFIYGYLSHTYGHLAVASMYIDGIAINAGLLRGLAGSSLGCLLFEICNRLSHKTVTNLGRILFTIAEIAGFCYLFYAMHTHPKSQYDYVLVFLIFGLLIVGISGLSVTSMLLNPRWTKLLATLSTLIVLNHCCWRDFLPQILGKDYATTGLAWVYYIAVACSCIVVYILNKVVRFIMRKMDDWKVVSA